MKYIIIYKIKSKVIDIVDFDVLSSGNVPDELAVLVVDELPDGCIVGSTATQDGDGNWTFTAPNHRIKAKAAIHAEYDYDHVNLDAIDELTDCMASLSELVHKAQVSDSADGRTAQNCTIALSEIKRQVTKRKRENEVIHALVGGDTTASSQALLRLSADTINATIKLVQQVSTDYGAASLDLLELHFKESLHFDADGNIVLPSAEDFDFKEESEYTSEPTNEEE